MKKPSFAWSLKGRGADENAGFLTLHQIRKRDNPKGKTTISAEEAKRMIAEARAAKPPRR